MHLHVNRGIEFKEFRISLIYFTEMYKKRNIYKFENICFFLLNLYLKNRERKIYLPLNYKALFHLLS